MSKDTERFAAIRKNFAGTARGPYLDVAVRGLMSQVSRAALDRHLTDLTEGTVDKPALFAPSHITVGGLEEPTIPPQDFLLGIACEFTERR